jgi:hypothetical protein
MAAREDQPQAVVGDPAHVDLLTAERAERLERLELRGLLAQRPFAAQPVDRTVARRRRDPRAGVVGDAAARPRRECLRERLLDRVLGDLEVAEDADQRRDRPAGLASEQPVDDLGGLRGRRRRPV